MLSGSVFHLERGHTGGRRIGNYPSSERYCPTCHESRKVVRVHPKSWWCELCRESEQRAEKKSP